MKLHGLTLLPLEHDAPVIVHEENTHPAFAVAETEIWAPNASRHPEEQAGETDPEPEATFVVKRGANAKAKLFAWGEPQPVTGSQPVEAE